MSRPSTTSGGTLVLDCEAMSRLIVRDRRLTSWLVQARADDRRVVVSAVTLVEVVHPGINRAALTWTLSRLVVIDVSATIARRAADLLAEVGRHGHQHAIDAMVCATALASPPPVVVLTSDPDDLGLLCGDGALVVPI